MKLKHWVAYILLGLVWSTSFLWIKIAVQEIGPFTLVAFRVLFGLITAGGAVILSGTASDGAAGVEAVKREGGIALAQDPSTAKYKGMPESAIATGAVDFVLPIPLLARQLSVIAEHPGADPVTGEQPPAPVHSVEDPILADLLTLVRSATKADFSHYKQSTVMRRISRRMAAQHVEDLEGYLELLRGDPAEVEALYQDLLIRVTSFFRQPEVFTMLKERIFPQLAEARAGGQLRFWVPGCASGEEAYSLAIAWVEFQSANHLEERSVQIFASDINQQVIDKARRATYPESIVSDVSPERLERFFSRFDTGYQIVKSIRETCVFAKHDLTRDPPFSRLDLISLRNVLIYLGPLLQRRVMPLLHFALSPGGFLMLGESESVGGFTDLFSPIEKDCIFPRIPLWRKASMTRRSILFLALVAVLVAFVGLIGSSAMWLPVLLFCSTAVWTESSWDKSPTFSIIDWTVSIFWVASSISNMAM